MLYLHGPVAPPLWLAVPLADDSGPNVHRRKKEDRPTAHPLRKALIVLRYLEVNDGLSSIFTWVCGQL